ncbi:MAG: tRNA lysidine(34) synthetase TilS, partial [Myxococcales bacterium]
GFDRFRRPFLDLTRAETEAACRDQAITWWNDPHNSDPRFLRASIRHSVMPVLEEQLGPGVAAALARTAESVREDVDALDDLAEAEFAALAGEFPIARLASLPPAIRHRVIRLAILAAGAPGSDLTRAHVLAVSALIEQPDPTKVLDLPGSLRASRTRTHLTVHS